MKNYRFLAPIVLVFLTVFGWYSLLNQDASVKIEYDKYLEQARAAASFNVTYDARINYKAALDIFDSAEVSIEAAEYFDKQNEKNLCIDWCEEMLVNHPLEPRLYEILAKNFLAVGDYQNCIKYISTAERRKALNDGLKTFYSEIEHSFQIGYNGYQNVLTFLDTNCAVMVDGLWGFVNSKGGTIISCKYAAASGFNLLDTNEELRAAVVQKDGAAYFVDIKGNKRLAETSDVAASKYASFGLPNSGVFPAVRKDNGKYSLLNIKFEELSTGYDYASTVVSGIAAVRKGDVWQIVKTDGLQVGDKTFSDIKIDDNNIATRNERTFVKIDSGYVMVDVNGIQIGTVAYEDVRPFADKTYAAVKSGDKWGFIDSSGKTIIEPKYDDARSFSNGLAAVKTLDLWGYIDLQDKLVIKNQFVEAREFSKDYSAFVSFGKEWKLITLYKYI